MSHGACTQNVLKKEGSANTVGPTRLVQHVDLNENGSPGSSKLVPVTDLRQNPYLIIKHYGN